MSDCDACGISLNSIQYHDANIYDDSGAVALTVCGSCREDLTADRCRICGILGADPSRSLGMDFEDAYEDGAESAEAYVVCDDCRLDLINDGTVEIR